MNTSFKILSLFVVLSSVSFLITPILAQDLPLKNVVSMAFNGNVKSANLATYKAVQKNGKITLGELQEYQRITFDEDGTAISEEQRNAYGNIIKVEYKNHGRPILQEQYNQDGTLLYKKTLTYDKDGSLIAVKDYNKDEEPLSKTIYTYDKNGNKITEEFYQSDGELHDRTYFKYNTSNQLIEEQYFSDAGEDFRKTSFTYNNTGHKIEENRYDYDGTHTYRMRYKYDSDGNKTEERNDHNTGYQGRYQVIKNKYGPNNLISEKRKETLKGQLYEKTVYTYDRKGNLIQETWTDEAGDVTLKITRQYDNNGHLTQETRENALSKETEVTDYVLDNYGNPQHIQITINDAPTKVSKAEFTYYQK